MNRLNSESNSQTDKIEANYQSYGNESRTISTIDYLRNSLFFVMNNPFQGKNLKKDEEVATLIYEFATESDNKKVKFKERAEQLKKLVLLDESDQARLGRKKAAVRAAYGEFMCTLLFLTPVFGTIVNATLKEYEPYTVSLMESLVGGFQAIAVSFAFSNVSGAHFNPAVSFALWLTNKLSNRRLIMYVCLQFLASIVAMSIVASIFSGDFQSGIDACAVIPVVGASQARVFGTEYFLTLILTYVAFTVAFEDAERQKVESMSIKTLSDSKGLTLYASTPQSKTGFAPFAIGFTIFGLSLVGGSSGAAFNPARMFGPALFSRKFDSIWVYWSAQVLGASTASLVVTNLHRFGIEKISEKDDIVPGVEFSSAVDEIERLSERLSIKAGINPMDLELGSVIQSPINSGNTRE